MPQQQQLQNHHILQPASQSAGQGPFMDEITAMLLAEDNPGDQAPANSQSGQPHQHPGEGSHAQGSQSLPGSDGGDELMRLLQQEPSQPPGTDKMPPGNPHHGPSASAAAPSGSQRFPEQPDQFGSHPRHTASGSSTHSGRQEGASGLPHGTPAPELQTGRLQQTAQISGQQAEANSLDPDWTPPGVEGDPWEPSSAPSSSFGDFLNNCPFDFLPGKPGAVAPK